MSSVGEEEQRGRLSRKSFLGKVGGRRGRGGDSRRSGRGPAEGAARLATGHGRAGINTQHFGRIFERMHPFAVPGKKGLEAALVDIGSPGGILDARDALDRGPVDLIVDLSLSAHNPNNPTHTAGDDVLWPVHGSRHDLRSRFAAGQAFDAPGLSERAHAVIRSRFGIRGRSRGLAAAVRPGTTARS